MTDIYLINTIGNFLVNQSFWIILSIMADKASKEESLDQLLDEKMDGLADGLNTKLLPTLTQKIIDMVEKTMADLIAESIRKEVQPMVDKLKVIYDENRSLKQRLDQVETQLRFSNLVFHFGKM